MGIFSYKIISGHQYNKLKALTIRKIKFIEKRIIIA